MRRVALLLVIAACAVNVAVVRAQVTKYIEFRPSVGDPVVGGTSKTYGIEVDATMDIVWKRDDLLGELATIQGVAPAGDPLLNRIETLKVAVEELIDAHGLLLESNQVGARLVAAQTDAQRERISREFQASRQKFAQKALDAIRRIGAQNDPAFIAEMNQAILQLDAYSAMAEITEKYLRELGDELARRVQSTLKVQVKMEAKLYGSTGPGVPVHLEGYDRITTGPPVPFPRFQLAPDRRTRSELEAAQGLARIANDFLDGTFEEEARKSLAELKQSLQQLVDVLQTDVLETSLQQLVQQLKINFDATLKPDIDKTISSATSVRNTLLSISDFARQLDPNQAGGQILQFANLISSNIATIVRTLPQVSHNVEVLFNEIESLLDKQSNIVEGETLNAIRQAKDSFVEEQAFFENLVEQFKNIAESLVPTGVVSESVDLIPREVGPDVSLDTRLDLQPYERHPGDILEITARVEKDMGTSAPGDVLLSGTRRFRLEVWGLYVEPRGALLFVDPRGAAVGDQNWKATTGLAFHARYGIRNKDFLNRFLPGIGVSFTFMDFDDDESLELGIGASASILLDLIWVGYGRNLQAESDYFYVGINPLTVVNLIRSGGL